MGVEFDRKDGFRTVCIRRGLAKPPAGACQPESAAGFLLDRAANDSFLAVNRLPASDSASSACGSPAGRGHNPSGGVVHSQQCGGRPRLRDWRRNWSGFAPAAKPFEVERADHGIADQLWDRYGGSMESGWTRRILEQFAFDFPRLPAQLGQGSVEGTLRRVVLSAAGAARSAAA